MFYHLTRSPLRDTARGLIGRAVRLGWRVMVRGQDTAMLAQLDADLWLGEDTEFLPHGMQGGPDDTRQPVLIGTGPAVNAAQALMLIGGAETLDGEPARMERTWILFDGNDPAAVEGARGQWRALTAMGLPAQYWSEETGKWTMQAEK